MLDWIAVHHARNVVYDKPVRATVWGRHYVVFRGASGTLHALDDRCAHRGAPLSRGRVETDGVRCPYHGWKYDGAGQCVDVPSLAKGKRLPTCKLASFPVVEQQGMVWLYPDVTEPPVFDGPPRLPILDENEWHRTTLSYDFGAPWQWLMENMCDGSHVPFAHASSVGRGRKQGYVIEELETHNRDDGRIGIHARSELYLDSLPAFELVDGIAQRAGWEIPVRNPIDAHIDVVWPTSLNVTIRLTRNTKVCLTTFFVPETPTTTRMDLVVGRTQPSARFVDWFAKKLVRRILDEDHQIARWSEEIGWQTTSGERSAPADGPALAFRKLLRQHGASVPFAMDDLNANGLSHAVSDAWP